MIRFKKLVGYDDYLICSTGQIISLKNKEEISLLTLIKNRNGYFYVCISKDNKKKTKSIHRLVAGAFIPNTHNKPQVNHIDGNKANNSASNLEWCTSNENMTHAVKNNLRKGLRGESCTFSKLKEHQVLKIRDLYDSGISRVKIAEDFNISKHTVSAIGCRRRWQHLDEKQKVGEL